MVFISLHTKKPKFTHACNPNIQSGIRGSGYPVLWFPPYIQIPIM